MAKRKRKEPAEAVNGESKQSKYTSRLFNDGRKLHEVRLSKGRMSIHRGRPQTNGRQHPR